MVLAASCAGLRPLPLPLGRSALPFPSSAAPHSASARQVPATAHLQAGSSTETDRNPCSICWVASVASQRAARPARRSPRCTCAVKGQNNSGDPSGCQMPAAASSRSFSPIKERPGCVPKMSGAGAGKDSSSKEAVGSRGRMGVVTTALRSGMMPGSDTEESASKASVSGTEPNSGAEPVKRRRGRPAGIPAWNKNKPMSEASKSKMRKTMQAKWKDKKFREEQKAVFTTKGRAPWNKGKSMSAETRQKMSEVRTGKRHSNAVRRKISMAHSRRPLPGHTVETQERLSAQLRGKPKTQEHKAAIAASMRRRHAAARVLAAVEDVHRELSAKSGAGVAEGARQSMSLSYESAAKSSGTTKQPTRSQVLNSYKAQLREYRNLQEELNPWTDAYIEKKGRKPSLADVENTQIEWLIVKYKQYILLRDRLLRDIPSLREKVGTDGTTKGGPDQAVVTTEGDTRKAEAIAKMKSAMEYRQRRQAASVPQATGDGGAFGKDHSVLKNLPTLGPNSSERATTAVEAALAYRREQAQKIANKARAAAAAAAPKEV